MKSKQVHCGWGICSWMNLAAKLKNFNWQEELICGNQDPWNYFPSSKSGKIPILK